MCKFNISVRASLISLCYSCTLVSEQVQKTKRIVQPKSTKNQKAQQINKDEEEANGAQNGQSSCSYSSEDDSNASQESNGGEASDNKGPALNLNGKTRASRGSATDPQSLYARVRNSPALYKYSEFRMMKT